MGSTGSPREVEVRRRKPPHPRDRVKPVNHAGETPALFPISSLTSDTKRGGSLTGNRLLGPYGDVGVGAGTRTPLADQIRLAPRALGPLNPSSYPTVTH